METETKSYPCESVLVRKELPELPAGRRGERSQCRPAMAGSDEAGQLHSEGWRIGLNDVRASAPTAKHVSLSPQSLSWKFIRLPSTTIRVTRAISWRKRHLNQTGEVPHRSGPCARIMRVHKASPKRRAYAMARRRLSQPPPPQGCQQSQSSGTGTTRVVKGKTDGKQIVLSGFMGIVSRTAPGHQMAGSSLFRSTRPSAKKHPPTPRGAAIGSSQALGKSTCSNRRK
jgi:hypothetical protein